MATLVLDDFQTPALPSVKSRGAPHLKRAFALNCLNFPGFASSQEVGLTVMSVTGRLIFTLTFDNSFNKVPGEGYCLYISHLLSSFLRSSDLTSVSGYRKTFSSSIRALSRHFPTRSGTTLHFCFNSSIFFSVSLIFLQ